VVAGSEEPPFEVPEAKLEVTPPIVELEPLPVLGVELPVVIKASGGLELKFHWVIVVWARIAVKPSSRVDTTELSINFFI
jgi:hypothetical protein